MDVEKLDVNKRIRALWCVDSETSEHYLIDIETKQIYARKDANGDIIWEQ